MKTLKIAVLASTKATDMQRIIDEIKAGNLNAKIEILISDRKDAYALERARQNNIEAIFLDPKGLKRETYDKKIMQILEKKQIDLILLIGYMRILSKEFVKKYKYRIMNIHPSLLPAFSGGMDKEVHQAVLKRGCKVSGCTLHFVDENVDQGPIIIQKTCPVSEDETVDSLKAKVQALEQEALIEGIKLFIENKLQIRN